jgi:D-arabinose 1-dehydrogenase-like Zn-dependent alcohol dehydrogenase
MFRKVKGNGDGKRMSEKMKCENCGSSNVLTWGFETLCLNCQDFTQPSRTIPQPITILTKQEFQLKLKLFEQHFLNQKKTHEHSLSEIETILKKIERVKKEKE